MLKTIRRFFIVQQLVTWLGSAMVFGATGGGSNGAAAPDVHPDKRPNIFFFFADDWGRYASIYSGDPVNRTLRTPSIDRVGREGVRFNNAHICSPSCTPSRSALFSGQYFYRTGRGAILRPAVWDSAIPSFPLLLEKAGYKIGHTYKAWGPGVPANAPFGAKRTQFVAAGNRFNQFSQNVTKLVSKGTPREAAKEELYKECLDNFDAFLASARRDPKDADKPFCYYFGPTNTHRTWEKGSGKALWGLNPDDLKGKLPKFLPDVPEVREDFCDYLGEVMALDGVLQRFLEKLESMGELENTIIVLSGDHGIPGFPRAKCNLYNIGTEVALLVRWGNKIAPGRTVDDFINLMDLAPTFLQIAGEKPPECMTGRSILPLLLSKQNGHIDPARDYVITGRERHVEQAREGNTPYPQRSIRTKDFLYIRNYHPERWPMGDPKAWNANRLPADFAKNSTDTRYAFGDMDASPTKTWLMQNGVEAQWKPYWEYAFGKRPGEELYDLRKDPDYLVNVANDPAYSDQRRQLAARLLDVLVSTGDPRVTGDGQTFERPPFAGPGTEEKPSRRE